MSNTIFRVVDDDQLSADWAIVTSRDLGVVVFVARRIAGDRETLAEIDLQLPRRLAGVS